MGAAGSAGRESIQGGNEPEIDGTGLEKPSGNDVQGEGENLKKCIWFKELGKAYGVNTIKTIGEVSLFLQEHCHCKMDVTSVSADYGLPEKLKFLDFVRFFGDLHYNEIVAEEYNSAMRGKASFTENTWQMFLVNTQEEVSNASKKQSIPPSGLVGFHSFLYSDENMVLHDMVRYSCHLDEPLTHYYLRSTLPTLDHPCDTPGHMKRFFQCIESNTRWLEIPIIDGEDGEPRAFHDRFQVANLMLPKLGNVLEKVEEALQSTAKDVLLEDGTVLKRLPTFIYLKIESMKDETQKQKLVDHVYKIFGDRVEIPLLKEQGPIPSPKSLHGKVIIAVDYDKTKDSKNIIDLAHYHVIDVNALREILADPDISTDDTNRQLEERVSRVILTMTPSEACTHMIELEAIADLLLMHVQSTIPVGPRKRKSVLLEQPLHPGALGGTEMIEIGGGPPATLKFPQCALLPQESKGNLSDEANTSTFSPLRAWKSGAQIVPIPNVAGTENVFNQEALFYQNAGVGYVPRACPLLVSNPVQSVASLTLLILAGTCIPRSNPTTQPYVRICCDSGNGLKQVAITSETIDNGIVCTWNEEFFFKIDLTRISTSSNIVFLVRDRDSFDNNIIAWGSVPLWGARMGFRSLPLFHNNNRIPHCSLLFHLQWQ